jgi:hypothetical protein
MPEVSSWLAAGVGALLFLIGLNIGRKRLLRAASINSSQTQTINNYQAVIKSQQQTIESLQKVIKNNEETALLYLDTPYLKPYADTTTEYVWRRFHDAITLFFQSYDYLLFHGASTMRAQQLVLQEIERGVDEETQLQLLRQEMMRRAGVVWRTFDPVVSEFISLHNEKSSEPEPPGDPQPEPLSAEEPPSLH